MKFKKDDRIIIYEGGKRYVGHVFSYFSEAEKMVSATIPSIGGALVVHEKQCRRLVKKRRMECWINCYPGSLLQGQTVFLTEDGARCNSSINARQVLFRQVIKTKGEKE